MCLSLSPFSYPFSRTIGRLPVRPLPSLVLRSLSPTSGREGVSLCLSSGCLCLLLPCDPLGRESVILCSSLLSLVLHRPVRPLGRESVILCSSSPCSRPSSTKHSCLLSFLSYPSARMPYLVLIIHKDERVDVPVFPRPSHPLVPIRLPGRESACSY